MMNASAQIERARQGDLLSVARGLGLPLKREGKYWRIPGHGGLMIYRKNGVWVWCQMSEERGGDAISFLTSSPVSQMSFREAIEMLTGEQWSSQDSKGFKGEKSPVPSLKPTPEPKTPRHNITLWGEKARAFCRWCHEQLMSPSGAKVRAWLKEKRGLHVSTIKKFGLGWNPRQFFRSKRDWGLDGEGRLCLPSGLVMPKFDLQKKLVGVTIRRLDDEQARKWGKYFSLPSPYGRPIWTICQELGPEDSRAGDWPLVVVEGELDAILLVQECPAVNIAVLGSAGRKPNPKSHHDFWQVFNKAQKVFLALDNDPTGEQALEWWLEQWEHTVPLLPPRGKDVTEASLWGVDLKQWLLDAFWAKKTVGQWGVLRSRIDANGLACR